MTMFSKPVTSPTKSSSPFWKDDHYEKIASSQERVVQLIQNFKTKYNAVNKDPLVNAQNKLLREDDFLQAKNYSKHLLEKAVKGAEGRYDKSVYPSQRASENAFYKTVEGVVFESAGGIPPNYEGWRNGAYLVPLQEAAESLKKREASYVQTHNVDTIGTGIAKVVYYAMTDTKLSQTAIGRGITQIAANCISSKFGRAHRIAETLTNVQDNYYDMILQQERRALKVNHGLKQ